MNERILVNVVLIVISLILAIFLGNWVVTSPKEVGMGFAVVMAIILFMVLNKNIWILIPASMSVGFRFPFIPGGFTTPELVSMYVVGCTILLLLSHKASLRIKVTSIEFFAGLVLFLLCLAYIRNPVGVMALGADNVGGRPYAIVIIGVSAGWVLSSTKTDYIQVSRAFKWGVLGYFATLGVQLAAKVSGAIASITGPLLGIGGSGGGGYGGQVDTSKATRSGIAASWGDFGCRFICSCMHPLKAIYNLRWSPVLFSILIAAAMSGFRSMIAIVGVTFLLGIYYWGKTKAVMLAGIIGILCYVGINIVNMIYPLPPNIQRSLSFLPGTWKERYVVDSESSTDWRVLMWEEALYTDRYIRNKFIGDGLGIQRSDFSRMQEISLSRVQTDEMTQERAMLAGDFHSGPVTTIKVIGYLGLVILTIAMIIVSVRAHRLIIESRDKPYFREAIFFCLPLVYMPFIYLFIFGSFKESIPVWFIQIGLLRLLENNLKYAEDLESAQNQVELV